MYRYEMTLEQWNEEKAYVLEDVDKITEFVDGCGDKVWHGSIWYNKLFPNEGEKDYVEVTECKEIKTNKDGRKYFYGIIDAKYNDEPNYHEVYI